MKSLLIVLGNQLFDKKHHPDDVTDIFMCEDFDLCTYEKHHKKKISFFLTSMREYKDEMSSGGLKVHYNDFNEADGKIGDGDLGITIQNGFQEIVNNKDNFTDDLGYNFMLCSQAFVKKSGSSFGTIVAFCLMNISKILNGKKFLKHEDIIEIFEICLNTIKERGKTNLGDKTILDTLDLILNKIKETKNEIKYSQIFKTSTNVI